MGILTSTTEFFVEKALCHLYGCIVQEIGYFRKSKLYVNNCENNCNILREHKEELEKLVNDALRNGDDIKAVVTIWIDDYGNFLQEKECGESTCQRCCPFLGKRYFEGKKASKIFTDSKMLLKSFQNIGAVSNNVQRPLDLFNKDFVMFPSRKSVYEKILKAIRSPDTNLIGLYGLPCVGKSTLVHQIVYQVNKDQTFDLVSLVVVPDGPDSDTVSKRIQSQIADDFRFTFVNESVVCRSNELRFKLIGRKKESRGRGEMKRIESNPKITKYLVILDDVFNSFKLEDIGIPPNENCKVMIISTNENTLCIMGVRNPFFMDRLSLDDSQMFFKKTLGDSFDESNLEGMPAHVADGCGGLPSSLEYVAKKLKGADFQGWKYAIDQLKEIDDDELDNIIYSSFLQSYNSLRSEELKTLFLMCGQLWRSSIPQQYLLYYGMGLDFIEACRSYDDFKKKIFILINNLIKSSLLEKGLEKNLMSMDDAVHSFAKTCGRKNPNIFISIKDDEWTKNDLLEKCFWLLISSDTRSSLPSFIQFSKLQALIIRAPKIHLNENFFDKMKELKVLDITEMNLSTLPSSFQYLLKLQTLCFHNCKLGDVKQLKVVGNLKELKVISFVGSNIKNLPIELGQLTHLEILNIEKCNELIHIPPNLLSKLIILKELLMDNSFSNWETDDSAVTPINANINEISSLTKLVSLSIRIPKSCALYSVEFPKNLEIFKILIGDFEDWYWDSDKTFQVAVDDSTQLPPSLMNLLNKAESVSICASKKVAKEFLIEVGTNSLQMLKYLHIKNSAEIDVIVDSMEQDQLKRSFINLEILQLHKCDKLKTLFPVSVVLLPKLQKLDINNCKNLEAILADDDEISHKKIALPSLKVLKLQDLGNLIRFCDCNDANFGSLDYLIIYNCPKMVSFNDCSSAFFNGKVTMPHLRELCLIGGDSIKMLWHNVIDPDSFGNLINLTIGECSSLKNLGRLSVIRNVEELNVFDCSSLEEMFDVDENDAVSSKLREFSIDRLPNLKEIWRSNSNLENLSDIYAYGCNSLRSLFPATFDRNLQRLVSLKITKCESLKVIIEVNETSTGVYHLPRLESLKLSSLKELESFCVGFHKIECPSLKKLIVFDCKLNVQSLFSLKEILPNLHSLSLNKDDKELFLQSDNSLENVKTLQLQNFRDKSEIFLTDLVQRFSGVEKLILRDCDFEEILNLNERITTLKLYSLEFLGNFMVQNLTKLQLCECHSLRYLFTPEIVRSLQQLVYLDVQDCNSLSEIMRNEGNCENVIFRELEDLMLYKLQSLRCFTDTESSVEFPSLIYLWIAECPAMKVFSKGPATAPELHSLYFEDEPIEYKHDLNETFQRS